MKEGTYLGGIRSLEDLRQRCRITACGCWVWAWSTGSHGTPSVSMVIDGKRTNMQGRRAALTMSLGQRIPREMLATAKKECTEKLCINPAHTELVSIKVLRQRTCDSATAAMRAAWVRNGMKQANKVLSKLTLEQVQAIRAARKPLKEIAAEFGVSISNVHRIRSHQSWRDPQGGIASNSSVFAWRPAA